MRTQPHTVPESHGVPQMQRLRRPACVHTRITVGWLPKYTCSGHPKLNKSEPLCWRPHVYFGVSPQVILMHEEASSHPPMSQGKIYRSWYGLNCLPRKVLKYQPSVPGHVTLLGARVFVDNQGKTRSLGWAPFQYELVFLQKGEVWTETHRKGECGFKRKTDIRMMYLQAEEHQGYV